MWGVIIFIAIVMFIVLIWAKRGWFPKKPLGFRIVHKSVGYVDLYKAQVKRPIVGWTGFWASKSHGEISSFSSWKNDRKQEEEYIDTYLALKGIPKERYKNKIDFKSK